MALDASQIEDAAKAAVEARLKALFDGEEDPAPTQEVVLERVADAVAKGVREAIDAIKDDADVRITTGDGALQRVDGQDTDAPSADRVLSGAIE